MKNSITCDSHGEQVSCMVCRHVVQAYRDRAEVDAFWANVPGHTDHRDVWCGGCEAFMLAIDEYKDPRQEILDRFYSVCSICLQGLCAELTPTETHAYEEISVEEGAISEGEEDG